jgi:hypothetical protein
MLLRRLRRYGLRFAVSTIMALPGLTRLSPISAQEKTAVTPEAKPSVLLVVMDDVGFSGSAQESVKGAGFAGFREAGAFRYSQGYGRQRLDADSGLAGLQGVPARA